MKNTLHKMIEGYRGRLSVSRNPYEKDLIRSIIKDLRKLLFMEQERIYTPKTSKAQLILNVRDSTVHESFCQDFCSYDCDNCNENCLEGIKERIRNENNKR